MKNEHKRGPTLAELREQMEDALREPEGVDIGPMTDVERNKFLFDNFGIE